MFSPKNGNATLDHQLLPFLSTIIGFFLYGSSCEALNPIDYPLWIHFQNPRDSVVTIAFYIHPDGEPTNFLTIAIRFGVYTPPESIGTLVACH